MPSVPFQRTTSDDVIQLVSDVSPETGRRLLILGLCVTANPGVGGVFTLRTPDVDLYKGYLPGGVCWHIRDSGLYAPAPFEAGYGLRLVYTMSEMATICGHVQYVEVYD